MKYKIFNIFSDVYKNPCSSYLKGTILKILSETWEVYEVCEIQQQERTVFVFDLLIVENEKYINCEFNLMLIVEKIIVSPLKQ